VPDPISVCFGLGGASVDVNALVRWFKEAPVRTVAYRFLKVFNDHGVKITQIQRLIPEVTLDKVTDPMALLPALTNDVLDRTAKLFGIERAWLDGVDPRMYRCCAAYQCPQQFFDELAALSRPHVWHPVRAFCVDPKLDRKSGKRQPLVLVLAEKIADWDDGGELVRFRPLTEEWLWDYPKSRLQLKAMLRAAHDHCGIKVIPIHVVDEKTLRELAEGQLVPPAVRHEHGVSLEDFILRPKESAVSKEADELDAVRSWIASMKIEEMARQVGDAAMQRVKTEREGLGAERQVTEG